MHTSESRSHILKKYSMASTTKVPFLEGMQLKSKNHQANVVKSSAQHSISMQVTSLDQVAGEVPVHKNLYSF